MALSEENFETRGGWSREGNDSGAGPVIEETAWGYIIRESNADHRLRAAGSITGRFAGAILLMAAAGLWVMPDSLQGADLFGFKLAAMVMFGVLGSYFVWAGRHASHPEFRIDKQHHEIRIGHRTSNGRFRQTTRVDFENVSSVFLLRSKDHRPTRLYLRLADLETGIEIATGNRARMEILKQRLTDDMTGQTGQPVAGKPDRPSRAAA